MLAACVAAVLGADVAAEETGAIRERLQSAAQAGLGGPQSAPGQIEEDRLRRKEVSRLPGLDEALNPIEDAKEALKEATGLDLAFDYQALYQFGTDSLTGTDDGALAQARMLANWEIFDFDGSSPGSFVFTLENRHRLGTRIDPGSVAGEIGYAGSTAVTFGVPGTHLSVAYWSQALFDRRAGFVVGRIDPGDYTDILGYVNPRTTFSNFSILFSPTTPIPDPGFGIGAGGFLTDQIYGLGVVSDANGSLSNVEWFPEGPELYKYAEIGWTPAREQRFLTNVHIGAFHVDEREASGVEETYGVLLSANHTIAESLMLFGRAGWSEGSAAAARLSGTAGLIWRPGFYDDLIGFAVNAADPSSRSLDVQTTAEAFYRFDLSDNIALTADVQYLINPGFNPNDPVVLGLRARLSL
ncbi:MAG: carbohydrate porin [Pseudomonadota bacterium]